MHFSSYSDTLKFGTQKVKVKVTLEEATKAQRGRRGTDIDIFVKLQLGSHPVAVVQYTYTHKQYTERNKTNNT
jgi:hypothetical protein